MSLYTAHSYSLACRPTSNVLNFGYITLTGSDRPVSDLPANPHLADPTGNRRRSTQTVSIFESHIAKN